MVAPNWNVKCQLLNFLMWIAVITRTSNSSVALLGSFVTWKAEFVHDAESGMFRMYRWYQDGVSFVPTAVYLMYGHDVVLFVYIIAAHQFVDNGVSCVQSSSLSAER
jgi:hypothetical protein